MAGAGYKLFNTGDVLTAQQVNEYLMQQTVMSFADSAARTTALSSVLAEGMVSYLRDTNVVEIYTGASWVSLDDPNAIQNTLLTTTGDLIYASAANTPARRAIGSTGDVLTVSGGLPTWAAPAAAGGYVLLATGTANNTSSTISFQSISSSYKHLFFTIQELTSNQSSSANILIRFNNDATSNNYPYYAISTTNGGAVGSGGSSTGDDKFQYRLVASTGATNAYGGYGTFFIPDYTSGQRKHCVISGQGFWNNGATAVNGVFGTGAFNSTSAINRVDFFVGTGNLNTGTIRMYGVQ